MSEENKNKSHGWLAMVIAVAITLPLLYVLGLGPAAAISAKHPKYRPVITEFYQPLLWLIYNNTPLRKPLEFYIHLWA